MLYMQVWLWCKIEKQRWLLAAWFFYVASFADIDEGRFVDHLHKAIEIDYRNRYQHNIT